MADSTYVYDPDEVYIMAFRKGAAQVVVADGENAMAYMDTYVGPTSMDPIQRAVTVARLRALADEIEKTE